ncbi:redox-sensing transcriptional repressor Rex [Desulfitobacterium sp. Sab5]|uniref:redox-sensing transcriptional repressor Rex n=1 Tax=Desulfitobacterium nosdiversum TaxID=3375356 RepID=UPI003CEF84CD
MITLKIPEAAIVRLSMYSRFLGKKCKVDKNTISSEEIAKGVGVNSAQVRKDLAYFGEFGIRGVGYNVTSLYKQILNILNLHVDWDIALVGYGHLGRALTSYKGFRERGFIFSHIFDNDPQKVGTKVNGIEVLPVERLEEVIGKNRMPIGIIATPPDVAGEIANSFVNAGVQSILNFAPIALNVRSNIEIRNVDLTVNLEVLTFNSVLQMTNDVRKVGIN